MSTELPKDEVGEKIGPNVKKLMIHKMSLDAVPPGCGDGFASAIDYLLSPEKHRASARAALEWVRLALVAVKSAPDNPYGEDDEVIAGELLKQIEERQKRQVKEASSR